MKLKITLLTLLFWGGIHFLYGQNFLNDPSIVAQHKRQVFESWGDWRPYPKYFLGIQTNFAYATVWGWLSPSINQDYKNGADIRPLKPTGLEVQRLVQTELQRKEAEKIKIEIDTLHKRNVQDLVHWTSATVDADPLWLLYYKRMLNPLKNFPENPQNHYDWNLKDDDTFQKLQSIGTISRLQEQLDLLKDKFHLSRTMDMPRGKRFLMYHETLIGWRKFINKIKSYDNKTTIALEYKKILEVFHGKDHQLAQPQSDKEIVQKIMQDYKHQF